MVYEGNNITYTNTSWPGLLIGMKAPSGPLADPSSVRRCCLSFLKKNQVLDVLSHYEQY